MAFGLVLGLVFLGTFGSTTLCRTQNAPSVSNIANQTFSLFQKLIVLVKLPAAAFSSSVKSEQLKSSWWRAPEPGFSFGVPNFFFVVLLVHR